MLAVFLVVGGRQVVKEISAAPAGKGLGFQIGTGIPYTIVSMIIVAALILLLGGIYYATARKDRITFYEAVFNWPIVVLAGIMGIVGLFS